MKKKNILTWSIVALACLLVTTVLLIGLLNQNDGKQNNDSTRTESDSMNEFDNDASDVF